MQRQWLIILAAVLLLLLGCKEKSWNKPHHEAAHANISYNSFSGSPRTLDPAKSYSSDETIFIAQIYEPPLQYHYLLRPYTLVPLTARQMPEIKYWDKNFKLLPDNAAENEIAYSTYDISIQPGIYYQLHPAFAVDDQGYYRYHTLTENDIANVNTLADFKYTGTRELTAAYYVYEIKRLAHPKVNSPILGIMSKHIVCLDDYAKQLRKIYEQSSKQTAAHYYLDLRKYDFAGTKVIDKYHYRITLQGKYPQFIYWLAMPFFAPVPWEADYFHSQSGMDEHDITFDWYPVGTGAYLLSENNPNRRMVLSRNPNFHHEYYPRQGTVNDQEKGYLTNAGKLLPFIDKYIFILEKEAIPRWNKFLQGYYDQSAIGSDNFDQAIQVDPQGNPHLTPELQERYSFTNGN